MVTINNPESHWLNQDTAAAIFANHTRIKVVYFVWQIEKGKGGKDPRTGVIRHGTLHVQGYFESDKRVTRVQVSKLFGSKANLEQRKGTQEQAITYCTKSDTRTKGPFSYGEHVVIANKGPPRKPIDHVAEMIKEGKSMREIFEAEHAVFLRSAKNIEKAVAFYAKKRTEHPRVTVCIGPTGTGKSYWAQFGIEDGKEIIPRGVVWQKQVGTKWFDGYSDEVETVVFNEFNGSWFTINQLKTLLDTYECSVEVKGSHVNFNSAQIIITSNHAASTWYPNAKEADFDAISRRVDVWRWMPEFSPSTWKTFSIEDYGSWRELFDAASLVPGLIKPSTREMIVYNSRERTYSIINN